MPNMANITVKNLANADVIYVAKVASSGDRTPARWTQVALNAIPAFQPSLAVGTKDDGTGKRRLTDINFAYPVIQTVAGVESMTDKVTFSGVFSTSKFTTAMITEEGAKQIAGLIASALLQEIMTSGYSAT